MKAAGAHVAYINPKEGALSWLDTWAMTKGVKDKDLAEQWVNFVLQKKIGQMLSDRNGVVAHFLHYLDHRPAFRFARQRRALHRVAGVEPQRRASARAGGP